MKYKKGFSLLELVIVLGLSTLIITAIWSFYLNSFNFNTQIRDNLLSLTQARRIGSTITKEMRGINYSASGSFPIKEAKSSSLIFFFNNNEGLSLRLRYFWEDNKFKRGVMLPAEQPPYYEGPEDITIIMDNINKAGQILFEYFDGEYNKLEEPVDLSLIRLIAINIFNQDLKLIFSTKASLRNIKDNL